MYVLLLLCVVPMALTQTVTFTAMIDGCDCDCECPIPTPTTFCPDPTTTECVFDPCDHYFMDETSTFWQACGTDLPDWAFNLFYKKCLILQVDQLENFFTLLSVWCLNHVGQGFDVGPIENVCDLSTPEPCVPGNVCDQFESGVIFEDCISGFDDMMIQCMKADCENVKDDPAALDLFLTNIELLCDVKFSVIVDIVPPEDCPTMPPIDFPKVTMPPLCVPGSVCDAFLEGEVFEDCVSKFDDMMINCMRQDCEDVKDDPEALQQLLSNIELLCYVKFGLTVDIEEPDDCPTTPPVCQCPPATTVPDCDPGSVCDNFISGVVFDVCISGFDDMIINCMHQDCLDAESDPAALDLLLKNIALLCYVKFGETIIFEIPEDCPTEPPECEPVSVCDQLKMGTVFEECISRFDDMMANCMHQDCVEVEDDPAALDNLLTNIELLCSFKFGVTVDIEPEDCPTPPPVTECDCPPPTTEPPVCECPPPPTTPPDCEPGSVCDNFVSGIVFEDCISGFDDMMINCMHQDCLDTESDPAALDLLLKNIALLCYVKFGETITFEIPDDCPPECEPVSVCDQLTMGTVFEECISRFDDMMANCMHQDCVDVEDDPAALDNLLTNIELLCSFKFGVTVNIEPEECPTPPPTTEPPVCECPPPPTTPPVATTPPTHTTTFDDCTCVCECDGPPPESCPPTTPAPTTTSPPPPTTTPPPPPTTTPPPPPTTTPPPPTPPPTECLPGGVCEGLISGDFYQNCSSKFHDMMLNCMYEDCLELEVMDDPDSLDNFLTNIKLLCHVKFGVCVEIETSSVCTTPAVPTTTTCPGGDVCEGLLSGDFYYNCGSKFHDMMLDCMYKDCLEVMNDPDALDNLLTNIKLLCHVKFGVDVEIETSSDCTTPTVPTTTTCPGGDVCEGLLSGDFYYYCGSKFDDMMLDCMVNDCKEVVNDPDVLDQLLTNIILLCDVKFGVVVEIEPPSECPVPTTTCPEGDVCDALTTGDFFDNCGSKFHDMMLDCMVNECMEVKDDPNALDNLLTNIILLCDVKFGVVVEIEPPSECPVVTTTCPEGDVCDALTTGDFFENCGSKFHDMMLDCMVNDCMEVKDDPNALDNLLTNIILLCDVKFGVVVEIEPPSECPVPTTTCPEGDVCDALTTGDFFEYCGSKLDDMMLDCMVGDCQEVKDDPDALENLLTNIILICYVKFDVVVTIEPSDCEETPPPTPPPTTTCPPVNVCEDIFISGFNGDFLEKCGREMPDVLFQIFYQKCLILRFYQYEDFFDALADWCETNCGNRFTFTIPEPCPP